MSEFSSPMRGVYSEENISEGLQNVSWITRVPGTIKECKDWIADTQDTDLLDFLLEPSHKLSWSHYYEILKADSDLVISFYTKQSKKHFL